MPPVPCAFPVPDAFSGARLDAALAVCFPDMGLRARRRLWTWCRVSVNGIPRNPGFVVGSGDRIAVAPLAASQPAGTNAEGNLSRISLVAFTEDYAAFFKPAGMHTAHVAGSPEDSLEKLLASGGGRFFPVAAVPDGAVSFPSIPILLTRLDKATSGLVLAAMHAGASERFRDMEREGKVEKTYIALLRGSLSGPVAVRNRLAVSNRARTGVLDDEEPDASRHTLAEPLDCFFLPAPWPAGTVTSLARVRIRRGARHQIRAHLAHAGYPLLGEWQYAPPPPVSCALCLHHGAVRFPDFAAEQPPDWSGPGLEAASGGPAGCVVEAI